MMGCFCIGPPGDCPCVRRQRSDVEALTRAYAEIKRRDELWRAINEPPKPDPMKAMG